MMRYISHKVKMIINLTYKKIVERKYKTKENYILYNRNDKSLLI